MISGTKVQDYYKDLAPPSERDLQLQLEELVSQGTLSPEQAQAILVEKSSLSDIQNDPKLLNAQMDALNQLQDISGSGGLTAMDRANLGRIQSEEATRARGAREAILQNAEARGAGGSGMSILAQLQNAQDSATRNSQRDLDVAGQAQQRALEALMQQGQLAGNIQGQQFGQKAQVAGAEDAIAKFNAQNRQNVGLTNVASSNAAQAANLAAKQGLADTNVATRNAQSQANAAAKQQAYQNQLQKAQGQTAVGVANKEPDKDLFGTIINAGAGIAGAALKSDEREKEGIEEFDASSFLDTLTPKKYRYKKPTDGVGDHAGVMAQDMEKTKEGSSAITETDQGKMMDGAKAANLALASAASLHKRLKKLEGVGDGY